MLAGRVGRGLSQKGPGGKGGVRRCRDGMGVADAHGGSLCAVFSLFSTHSASKQFRCQEKSGGNEKSACQAALSWVKKTSGVRCVRDEVVNARQPFVAR